MRVPMNWLNDYIHIADLSSEEIAEKLTQAGVEVEGIDRLVPQLPGVLVAEVLSFTRHPAAHNLWIVKVTTGSQEYQVVAGIQNYAAGDKVPLALPGTRLPGGRVEAREIRGITSSGMLCSAEELGLELAGDRGILILDSGAVPGIRVDKALALDEEILELGLTPNRSDCLGLLGVALEVGVLTGRVPRLPTALPALQGGEAAERVAITIEDPQLCSRYTAMVVDHVQVAPSPLDFQIRLLKAGIRPINNVVDVSNYVMWETGQPLHTFDFDRVKGHRIIVRRAREDERIVTLDRQERLLNSRMLVIADGESPVALAGVMGGFDSEITGDTKTVLIEAACFHPINNRRTARSLGLASEASTRFEKGVDPEGTGLAARRTAYFLEKMARGRAVPGTVDIYPRPLSLKTIILDPRKARDLMGLHLSKEDMGEILARLGFSVEDRGKTLSVTVPSRRQDIHLEVDLVEEVARIYGYQHIETTFPVGVITQGEKPLEQKNLDKVRQTLLGGGLSEAITFSFMKGAAFDALRLPSDHGLRQAIPVKNPLSEEYSLLRTTLLGNLLDTVKYNLNRQQEGVCIFEVGKIFKAERLPLDAQPRELMTLGLALSGHRRQVHWQETPLKAGFFWLKGMVEGAFAALNVQGLTFKPAKIPYLHPTQGAEVFYENRFLGVMGTLHPGVQENYHIGERVYCAELDLSFILRDSRPVQYRSLPRYPAIIRDLALNVPEGVTGEAVEHIIRCRGGDLVESVHLFDVYSGKQVSPGYKSLAYSVTYRDYRETLRDQKVNELQRAILINLEELGITLRS